MPGMYIGEPFNPGQPTSGDVHLPRPQPPPPPDPEWWSFRNRIQVNILRGAIRYIRKKLDQNEQRRRDLEDKLDETYRILGLFGVSK